MGKKQNQRLDKVYEFNKKKIKQKAIAKIKNKKRTMSNLFYSNKFIFFNYYNVEQFQIFLLLQNRKNGKSLRLNYIYFMVKLKELI